MDIAIELDPPAIMNNMLHWISLGIRNGRFLRHRPNEADDVDQQNGYTTVGECWGNVGDIQ